MKKLEAECLWTHLSENKKKKKKERKEGKKARRKKKKENVYGSTQWGTDKKHFFFQSLLSTVLCQIPFLFP